MGLLALVVIWSVVIRPWRREGHLTLDGMMVISCATMWAIQDPWVSYSQTTISYNSTAVNLGCPQCHAPGWQSSQALAEPIIWGLGCYIGPMYLATLLAGKLMSRARERWPRTGKFGLTMIAIGSLAVADLVLEIFWTRTGVYTYGGGHPVISLFDEHYYKYPLWVGAIWGVAWGLIAAVRFFRDDRGHTVAERGINRVNTTPRRKQPALPAGRGVRRRHRLRLPRRPHPDSPGRNQRPNHPRRHRPRPERPTQPTAPLISA